MNDDSSVRYEQEPLIWFKNYLVNERVSPGLLTQRRSDVFPFPSHFVRSLLHNKHIVIIGDSLARGLYKDLVALLQSDELVDEASLKTKAESSFLGDRLIDHLPLVDDRVWRQAREYQTNSHLVQFFFTTRAMKNDMDKFLLSFLEKNELPDVVVMESILWDITRYTVNHVDMSNMASYPHVRHKQAENEHVAMEEYLNRLSALLRRFRVILPPTCQVVWLCLPWTIPEGKKGYNARLDIADKKMFQRILCNDANYRAAQIVRAAGYDVLDLCFYMKNHMLHSFRTEDGVHWDAIGTRFMTQLLVGHLSLNITLPESIQQRLEKFTEALESPAADFLNFSGEAMDLATRTHRDNFSEPLHRHLANLTLQTAPGGQEDALKEDVKLMRVCLLLQNNPSCQLSSEDTARLAAMAANPRVLSLCRQAVPVQRVTIGPKRARSVAPEMHRL